MAERIYFNGAGLVTALGDSVEQALSVIESGGVKPGHVVIKQSSKNWQIPYFIAQKPKLDVGDARIEQMIDRAINEAVAEAGLSEAELQQAGLFVGSTSFDVFKTENAVKEEQPNRQVISSYIHAFTDLTDLIQARFAIKGPVYTYNSACTSSANALIYASECIRRGEIKHALVLGLEFYNEVTALGFSALELLSKKGMSPFDKERDGLYLGEGCGALIISAEPSAHGFHFVAGSNLGDNFSITASNPEGDAVQKVVQRALRQADLKPSDIALIKTHGTASLSNDESEASGLAKAFDSNVPPIVSLKPFIGHTLGACGINELIIFYKALAKKKLLTFPCVIDDSFALKLACEDDRPERGHYLLNYFGFGGNSTVLVIAND
jgi:3-oxoacyl-[acyl-carrier-protein] synthase-1